MTNTSFTTDQSVDQNSLKHKASDAVQTARLKAAHAREAAAEKAKLARARATTGLEQNPLAAIAGGLALGAIIASVLPNTRKEDEVLGPIGAKIRSTAKWAAASAKDAGAAELAALGVSSETAQSGLRKLVEKIGTAAKTASDAAMTSVKKPPTNAS